MVLLFRSDEDGLDPDPVQTFSGAERDAEFGRQVAVSDLDQDGLVDLLIGVARADTTARDTGAVEVHRGLENAEVPKLNRVRQFDFSFAPGVEVTEIEQTKGLEFDYVILVEVSARYFPDRPGTRHRLHVAVTRAIHQLWITTTGTPSPLVPPWPRAKSTS